MSWLTDRMTPCGVLGCGATPTDAFLFGPRCTRHAPVRSKPKPGTTLDDFLARAALARKETLPPRREPPGGPIGEPVGPRHRAGSDSLTAANLARVETARARARRFVAEPHAHAGTRPTSADAARRVLPKTGTQRRAILDALLELHQRTPGAGATDLQLGQHLHLEQNSVRPRRGELVDHGLVEDSGMTREHHGAAHIVWRVTGAALAAMGHRPR